MTVLRKDVEEILMANSYYTTVEFEGIREKIISKFDEIIEYMNQYFAEEVANGLVSSDEFANYIFAITSIQDGVELMELLIELYNGPLSGSLEDICIVKNSRSISLLSNHGFISTLVLAPTEEIPKNNVMIGVNALGALLICLQTEIIDGK